MSEIPRCSKCGNERWAGCPEVGDWTYCPHPVEPQLPSGHPAGRAAPTAGAGE